jgi:hypothetical protein
MTPKEKAKELIGKFSNVPLLDSYEATQCALILVDEILKLHKKLPLETLEYYVEVKHEIVKL